MTDTTNGSNHIASAASSAIMRDSVMSGVALLQEHHTGPDDWTRGTIEVSGDYLIPVSGLMIDTWRDLIGALRLDPTQEIPEVGEASDLEAVIAMLDDVPADDALTAFWQAVRAPLALSCDGVEIVVLPTAQLLRMARVARYNIPAAEGDDTGVAYEDDFDLPPQA